MMELFYILIVRMIAQSYRYINSQNSTLKWVNFTVNYILTLKKRKGSLRKEIRYIQNKGKNYLLKIKAK